jgi:hypothetical protein
MTAHVPQLADSGRPSRWQPVRFPQDHPDSPAIWAALCRAGAGTILAGRIYIGDDPDHAGCLTVYQEADPDSAAGQDRVLGLAVPGGDSGWYLGLLRVPG